MSKAATYNAIAQGLGALGGQMQYNMQQDALQRRQESLLALRQQFNQQESNRQLAIEDARIADNRKYQERQNDKQWNREQGLMKQERALNEPFRQAELASNQAEIDARQARTGLMNAQTEALRAPGGGAGLPELTALEKEIPLRFRQNSLEVASTQAPSYFSDPRNPDYPPSVSVLVSSHPQVAESLGISEQTPLNEAMGKVEEALYRSRIERYSNDFSGPSRGLMGPPQAEGNDEPAPYAEGQRLTGPDGRIYVVRNGVPVLEQ